MDRFLRGALAAVFACVIALTAACDNGGSSTPTSATPAAPTNPPTTELFSGSVPVGRFDFHTFTTTQSGEIDATLMTAGPPTTIFMGFALGIPSSDLSACSVDATAETATQPSTVAQLSFMAPAGLYCVSVFDIGNAAVPIGYSVQVVHH